MVSIRERWAVPEVFAVSLALPGLRLAVLCLTVRSVAQL